MFGWRGPATVLEVRLFSGRPRDRSAKAGRLAAVESETAGQFLAAL